LRLTIQGSSLGPIDETIGTEERTRALYVGANGSGKSLRLAAIELATTGRVAALGGMPGDAAVLSPQGTLDVALSLGGRTAHVVAKRSPKTRTVTPLADCQCRTLAFLDGSPEKVKAFLAAHVVPAREWFDAERISKALVDAGWSLGALSTKV
jgi:hypothetical protein